MRHAHVLDHRLPLCGLGASLEAIRISRVEPMKVAQRHGTSSLTEWHGMPGPNFRSTKSAHFVQYPWRISIRCSMGMGYILSGFSNLCFQTGWVVHGQV